MADCFPFPPESDDLHLHRRWLPREIFADIGIVDPDSAAAVADPATPEAAAATAAAVEELAAQLAGILGSGGGGGSTKVWPLASPPPLRSPSPPAAPATATDPQVVCGMEGGGSVAVVAPGVGGANAAAAVTAVSSWPFVPYPQQQLQWQVGGSNLVNHGGVLDCYPMLPPCHVPPPANLRTGGGGGTGVFLPRVQAYRHATATHPPPPTAKGGAWAVAAAKPSSSRPALGKKQTEYATPTTKQHHQKPQQATAGTGAAALALPQDWSYR